MTTKQKQCLLAYLGYYQGGIDGIWGQQSRAATREFQEDYGLADDGNFGDMTEVKILEVICRGCPEDQNWWEEIEYFDRREFACKCGQCSGYPAEMSRELVECADRMRKAFGVPITVSSGLRCVPHNARVGGVSNSRHLSGRAMDFSAAGKTAAAVLEFVQQQPEIRYAYAIDGSFVHMDVD